MSPGIVRDVESGGGELTPSCHIFTPLALIKPIAGIWECKGKPSVLRTLAFPNSRDGRFTRKVTEDMTLNQGRWCV